MTCSIYFARVYNKTNNQWCDRYTCYLDHELFLSIDSKEIVFDPYKKTIRPVCLDDSNGIPLIPSNRTFSLPSSLMNESLVGKYNVTQHGTVYWLHPSLEEGV